MNDIPNSSLCIIKTRRIVVLLFSLKFNVTKIILFLQYKANWLVSSCKIVKLDYLEGGIERL